MDKVSRRKLFAIYIWYNYLLKLAKKEGKKVSDYTKYL